MQHDFRYLSRPEFDVAAQELELQTIARHSIDVLGNRLQFSDWAADAFNHWVICPPLNSLQ